MRLFIEIEAIREFFPDIAENITLKMLTKTRGMFQYKQQMPWPLNPRDAVSASSCVFDKVNKALLVCSRLVEFG
jgi:hypothetical protein